RAERGVLGGVVVERALAARPQQAGVHEPLEVMAQRRRGHVHVRLDVTGRRAFVAALDDEAQDGEPYRMAKRAQLLGMAVEFRRHAIILTNSKEATRGTSSILETKLLRASTIRCCASRIRPSPCLFSDANASD